MKGIYQHAPDPWTPRNVTEFSWCSRCCSSAVRNGLDRPVLPPVSPESIQVAVAVHQLVHPGRERLGWPPNMSGSGCPPPAASLFPAGFLPQRSQLPHTVVSGVLGRAETSPPLQAQVQNAHSFTFSTFKGSHRPAQTLGAEGGGQVERWLLPLDWYEQQSHTTKGQGHREGRHSWRWLAVLHRVS